MTEVKSLKIDEIDGVEYFTKAKDYGTVDDTQVNKCVDDLRTTLKRFESAQASGLYLTDMLLESAVSELKLKYGDLVFNDAYTRVTYEHFRSHATDMLRSSGAVNAAIEKEIKKKHIKMRKEEK